MKMARIPTFWLALMALVPLARPAQAYDYADDENRINVSGAVCRGQDGAAEYNLYHYPGSTSAGTFVTSPVRVYCPTNRRSLHTYDRQLDGFGEDVTINDLWVKVDSPSGNLQCRLFARDRFNGTSLYSNWQKPDSAGTGVYIYFSWGVHWSTVNWGVMCDIPAGEAIWNIDARVKNQNF